MFTNKDKNNNFFILKRLEALKSSKRLFAVAIVNNTVTSVKPLCALSVSLALRISNAIMTFNLFVKFTTIYESTIHI